MEDSGTKNADGMKNMFKFFAAAFAIVAAASCTKENPSTDSQVSDQKLVHKVFTATLDSDTKTTLVPGEDGSFVHWVEGDQIKVIPEGQTNATLFDILSIDGTHANFAGEIVEANSYRAVYPASALYVAKSFNEFLLTDEYSNALALQYAVENDFSVAASFGAPSNFAVSSSCSNNRLEFCNINAYLKINLAMDNASEIEISASRVTGFSSDMMSSSRGLGGAISYLVDEEFVYISSGTQPIVFKNQDGSNLKQDVDYYIAIPAVTIENLKLVVKDNEGKQITMLKRSKNLQAEANKIYNLGAISPDPEPEPAKVGDYFYYDGTYSTELDNSKEVVGVVFFVGDPTEDDSTLKRDYPGCTHGLVVGLEAGNGQWLSANRKVYDWAISNGYHTTQQFTYSGRLTENDNAKYMWGYNNTCAIREYAKANGLTSGIVNFADSYGVAVANASPWYIPSVAEMKIIRQGSFKSIVESLGGDALSKVSYYMSAEENEASYIPTVNFSNGSYYDGGSKTSSTDVFAIFAF